MRPGKLELNLSTTEVLLGSRQSREPLRPTTRKAAVITMLLLVGALVWCTSAVLAKEKKLQTKSVSGVVFNEAENTIEGAMVELADAQTGKVLDIYSQQGGTYQFTDLSFDHDYTVKATFKGISSEVRHVSSVDLRARLVLNLTIPETKH
jgi:hypothetical protein